MRLIDADALKETLKSNCKPELCHDYKTAWCVACCPHNDFVDLLDNAPTVKPTFGMFKDMCCADCERTPHGKWTYDYRADELPAMKRGWICSNCGFRTGYGMSPYCMNCGAQMEKEEKNETN